MRVTIEIPEVVQTVFDAIENFGFRVLLAGGIVRDAVRGVQGDDIDCVVVGIDTPQELSEMLAEINLPVIKGSQKQGAFVANVDGNKIDFAVLRNESNMGTRHDVPVFGATIRNDAERRDFTVNAMFAVRTSTANEWRVIDPLGGLQHIQSGILDMSNPEQFESDHVRIMRAIRFTARDNMVMSERLVQRIRSIMFERQSNGILFDARLNREMFAQELMKALAQTERPSRVFEAMRNTGIVAMFMPELLPMQLCEQDPQWHPEGNVWNHTMHAVDAMAQWCDDQNGVSGQDRAERVMWMLTHDIGKPSFGQAHAEMGIDMAQTLGDRIFRVSGEKDSARITRDMMTVCELHMRHIAFRDGATRRAVRKLARVIESQNSSVTMEDLFAVNIADTSARPFTGELVTPQSVVSIREVWDELNAVPEREAPIVTGKMLIGMGMSPSPSFSSIISDARIAQDDEVFSDRRGATEWVWQHPLFDV